MTEPLAWESIEDALQVWVTRSTGLDPKRVRVQQPRDSGEARGPYPKATISLLTFRPDQQQGRSRIPSIVRQRYRVLADGPGEVGVDFYAGTSLEPERISTVAGPGDPPATSAAALLVELQANLPDGYTASANPDDDTEVIVDGSEEQPLFTAAPANSALLSVTTSVPRFPVFLRMRTYLVWRIEFRADAVSGSGMAANLMAKAELRRASLLDPAMHALGLWSAGTPASLPSVPATRDESLAVLDVAYFGHLTGAQAATALRAIGLNLTAA